MKTRHTLTLNKLSVIILALMLMVTSAVLPQTHASAANAKNFDPGNIIDDAVFSNKNSMSVAQIQAFLDSKVTCDTYGKKQSELGGGTRAQWLKSHGINVPITCINGYYENPANGKNNYGKTTKPSGAISAAQIIYNYSRQFDINPQAIIVTLQKENGLITDEWPTPRQYTEAMGFGCPDNRPAGAPACDPEYKSFSTQVYEASRHFRGFMDRDYCNANWCTPKTTGENNILWNPNASCGSSTVNIRNRATVALYSYTPYRPNQAALNAGYGTGDDCSSYGNRNFYLYFTDWFGSTRYTTQGSIGTRYVQVGTKQLGKPLSNEITLATGGKYQKFENGRVYWKSGIGAWEVMGSIGDRYVKEKADASSLGYPKGSESTAADGKKYQNFEGGRIYWQSGRGTQLIYGKMGSYYLGMKAHASRLGYPKGNVTNLATGGKYQLFDKGRIYWSTDTGAWDIGGKIGDLYINSGADTNSRLGYPRSSEKSAGDGYKYQEFEAGRIYWSSKSGTRLTTGKINQRYAALPANRLGYPTSGEISISTGGRYQQFTKGRIYWKSATGAWDIGGKIGDRYLETKGTSGTLGYPTGGEVSIAGGGKYQQFEGGRVYWKSATGARSAYGKIGSRYVAMGANESRLRYPTSNEFSLSTGGRYQQFEGGRVYWKSATGAWDVGGSIGALYHSLGGDKGKLGYPTGTEVKASGSITQQFEKGTITYKNGKATHKYK